MTLRIAADLDDVRRVTAARPFGVEGVDGAALDGADRVLDETALVQRIGVDHHLHVVFVGDRQAAVDGSRRRAPVLMQLQAGCTRKHHFNERCRQRGIALAGERQVHRKAVETLDHPLDMPGAGAGRGKRAVGRATAAAQHRRDARHQRFLDLLRADEMDMRIHAAGRQDLSFPGDHLRRRSDDDGHARLRIRIAGLADPGNAAILQADIGLDDAPVIDDQRIGDDSVDSALGACRLALAHAVTDDLAAAELHLVAIGGEVLFHLDEQFGIGQPNLVAGGRAEHRSISRAGHLVGHGFRLLGKTL